MGKGRKKIEEAKGKGKKGRHQTRWGGGEGRIVRE